MSSQTVNLNELRPFVHPPTTYKSLFQYIQWQRASNRIDIQARILKANVDRPYDMIKLANNAQPNPKWDANCAKIIEAGIRKYYQDNPDKLEDLDHVNCNMVDRYVKNKEPDYAGSIIRNILNERSCAPATNTSKQPAFTSKVIKNLPKKASPISALSIAEKVRLQSQARAAAVLKARETAREKSINKNGENNSNGENKENGENNGNGETVVSFKSEEDVTPETEDSTFDILEQIISGGSITSYKGSNKTNVQQSENTENVEKQDDTGILERMKKNVENIIMTPTAKNVYIGASKTVPADADVIISTRNGEDTLKANSKSSIYLPIDKKMSFDDNIKDQFINVLNKLILKKSVYIWVDDSDHVKDLLVAEKISFSDVRD